MVSDLSGHQEDYLRVILDLLEKEGLAKIRDISRYKDVSPASVVQMMRKLHEKKFVIYKKYGGVSLTPEGRNIAEKMGLRYEILRQFLEILQVPEHIAKKEAYILGHHLDSMTVTQFSRFVEFATSTDHEIGSSSGWEEMFKRYCNDEV
jgi:DtxR family Mn-dependent transcriptional regulator